MISVHVYILSTVIGKSDGNTALALGVESTSFLFFLNQFLQQFNYKSCNSYYFYLNSNYAVINFLWLKHLQERL